MWQLRLFQFLFRTQINRVHSYLSMQVVSLVVQYSAEKYVSIWLSSSCTARFWLTSNWCHIKYQKIYCLLKNRRTCNTLDYWSNTSENFNFIFYTQCVKMYFIILRYPEGTQNGRSHLFGVLYFVDLFRLVYIAPEKVAR